MSTLTPRQRRRLGAGGPGALLVAPILVLAFLYLPVAVVIVYSLNSKRSFASFGELSLRWYGDALGNTAMWASALVSVRIALIAVVGAVVLGTALAFALDRLGRRTQTPAMLLVTLVLVTPEVSFGFSLLLLFTSVAVPLSLWTVALGHVTFAISYVVLMVRARLARMERDVEEAARDLGAGPWTTLWLVVLPQLRPTLLGAALLVFVLSFDDFVTSMFTTGTGTPPLPVYVYGMLKVGVTPEVNAIGTLFLLISVGLGVLGVLVSRVRTAAGRDEVLI
ncbi:ABC transporter permease [Mycolicibacterium confluentis]|uniref:ABC transporter permease n=1 Tax=Mycolicibacterium confluentis TaxID=28047 RepID=UPI0013D3951B|nr:ABC transporter permease [Mycolicibacterium confluentis]MCV7320886.1 ABC transporter permease [Mycolicibacterium confluentis]